MSFSYRIAVGGGKLDFAIHHHIHSDQNNGKSAQYMQQQHLTPWVAVAAPLRVRFKHRVLLETKADNASLIALFVGRFSQYFLCQSPVTSEFISTVSLV